MRKSDSLPEATSVDLCINEINEKSIFLLLKWHTQKNLKTLISRLIKEGWLTRPVTETFGQPKCVKKLIQNISIHFTKPDLPKSILKFAYFYVSASVRYVEDVQEFHIQESKQLQH